MNNQEIKEEITIAVVNTLGENKNTKCQNFLDTAKAIFKGRS